MTFRLQVTVFQYLGGASQRMPQYMHRSHSVDVCTQPQRSHCGAFGLVARTVALALFLSCITLCSCTCALGTRYGTLQKGFEPAGGALRRLQVALDKRQRQHEGVAPPCAATVFSERGEDEWASLQWASLQTRVASDMLGYQVRLGQLRTNPKPLSCRAGGIGRQLPRRKPVSVAPPSERTLKTPADSSRRNPVQACAISSAGHAHERSAVRRGDYMDVEPLQESFTSVHEAIDATRVLDADILEEMAMSLSSRVTPAQAKHSFNIPGAPHVLSFATGVATSAAKVIVSVTSCVRKVETAAMQKKNLFVQELFQSSVTVAAAYAPALGFPRALAISLSFLRTMRALAAHRSQQRKAKQAAGEVGEEGGLWNALAMLCEGAAWCVLDAGGAAASAVAPTRDPAALLGLAQRSFGQNVCRRIVEEVAGKLQVGAAVMNMGLLGVSGLGCKLVGCRYTTDGKDLHVNGCFCQGLDDSGGFKNLHVGLFGQREDLCGWHALADIPLCAVDILLGLQGVPTVSARHAIHDPQVQAIVKGGGLIEGHSLGNMDVRWVKEKLGWAGEMVMYSPPPTVGWDRGVHSLCMDRDPICGGPLAKVLSIGTTVVRVKKSMDMLVHARDVYRVELDGAAEAEGLAELSRMITGSNLKRLGPDRHLQNFFSSLHFGSFTSIGRPLLPAWVAPQ